MLKAVRTGLFFTGILLGVCLLNVEITAVNLALAAITKSLHISLANSQIIITSMLLSFAAIIVTAGKLGDTFGYYKIISIGLLTFIIGALISGFALNSMMMNAGRLLQGVGAGFCSSNLVIYGYQCFPPEKRGLASGLLLGTVGFAMAVGPIFGGFFTQVMTWRWIFFADIPFCVGSLLLMTFFMPENMREKTIKKEKVSIDYPGAFLMAVVIAGFILFMEQGTVSQVVKDLALCVSLLGLIVFYFIEKKTKNPVIDFELLKKYPDTLVGFIGRFLTTILFFAILFVLGLYLVDYLSMNPLKAGVVMMPMTLVIGIFSPLAGIIVDKTNSKGPIIVSLFGFIVSFCLFYFFARFSFWTLFYIASVLFGLAFSLYSTAVMHFTFSGSPKNIEGVVSGIFYMFGLISGIAGLPVCGMIIDANQQFTDKTVRFEKILCQTSIFCLILSVSALVLFGGYFLLSERRKTEKFLP